MSCSIAATRWIHAIRATTAGSVPKDPSGWFMTSWLKVTQVLSRARIYCDYGRVGKAERKDRSGMFAVASNLGMQRLTLIMDQQRLFARFVLNGTQSTREGQSKLNRMSEAC